MKNHIAKSPSPKWRGVWGEVKLMVAFISLWIAVGQARAQTHYTLADALEKAKTQNLSVQNALTDEKISTSKIHELKSNFLPQASFNANYQYTFDIMTNIMPARTFNPSAPSDSYLVAQMGVHQSVNLSAQVRQTIYNPSLKVGLQMATVSQDMMKIQTKKSLEDVVFNVQNTYFNIQLLQCQIAFVSVNQTGLQKLVELTEKLQKGGLAKKIEVERLQMTIKNLELQKQNAEVNIQKLKNVLQFLMGTPAIENITVDDFSEENFIKLENLADTGQRTDLALLETQTKILYLEQKNIRAGYLPTINANGTLAYMGFNNRFNPIETINKRLYPNSFVGVQLSMPIFDGMMRHRQLKTKQLDTEKLLRQKQIVIQNAEVEKLNAKIQYEQNVKALDNLKENIALAEKNMNLQQTLFKAGQIAFQEIVNAQNSIEEAQNNYLNGLLKIKIAELEWKKANGKLAP